MLILTLAADLEGGGAALGILTRTDYRWWVFPLGAATVLVLVYGNYRPIERALRYIALPLGSRTDGQLRRTGV